MPCSSERKARLFYIVAVDGRSHRHFVCAFYCTAADFGGAESVQRGKHLAARGSVNEKIRTGARHMRENGVPKNKACSANCRLLKKETD
ncbi:hypothetical protein [Comamonas sp. UBA7528]|uniref:hypothetical protein n=1 Tax=Comamonas sp. UBA7528 TaxID=1946391 RepID=UPI0025BC0F25|nr:hypothetical protein [Comamonas sp. UBA7528]